MAFHRSKVLLALAALLAMAGCVSPTGAGPVELGDFTAQGKADAVPFALPFELGPGEEQVFTLRTAGRLDVELEQSTSERLQLIAESMRYRRRSWRGRTPFLRVPAEIAGGELTEYVLTLVNWGDEKAQGVLHITTVDPITAGIQLIANQPDCADCADPAGELRRATVDAIQNASVSIDMAVYGFDDHALLEALCEAHARGVRVRVVSDGKEARDPSRPYYERLLGEERSLHSCGIPVELIDYSGIMHNKYYVIDSGTPEVTLVTGSANQTEAGFEDNHNHALIITGSQELADAYGAEFDQLFRHCEEKAGCSECTPACTLSRASEGPFAIDNAEAHLYFSPSDDALRALRGPYRQERRDAVDPACASAEDCLCLPSGSRFACFYCGIDGDWGLLGQAQERALATLYALTDVCTALAMRQAQARGLETVLLIDNVNAGSPYSVHERVCAGGVETLITEWGRGTSAARNHHKLFVLDDLVFTGSMNISGAAVSRNHENTLAIASPELAETATALIRSEVATAKQQGVSPLQCETSPATP